MYFWCICGEEGDLRVLLFHHLEGLSSVFTILKNNISISSEWQSIATINFFLNNLITQQVVGTNLSVPTLKAALWIHEGLWRYWADNRFFINVSWIFLLSQVSHYQAGWGQIVTCPSWPIISLFLKDKHLTKWLVFKVIYWFDPLILFL